MAIHISNYLRNQICLVSMLVCAGGFGGVIFQLLRPLWVLIHLAGKHGVLTHFGGKSHLSSSGMYHSIVWGALWGLVFYIPLKNQVKDFWARAFLYALPPALWSMLLLYPQLDHHAGLFSLGVGILTPLYAILVNFVAWSLPAYLWLAAAGYAGPNPAFNTGESEPLLE